MVLVIDNYDSFTYNLVQAFLILGAEVEVRRNDEITVSQAKAAAPTHPAAPAAQNGSPSLATGHPRARSAIGQFFALSTSWSFLSQGIIPRNRLPTSSMA